MASKNKDKKAVSPATIENRRARFDYSVLEDYEAGIALVGSEVKSVFHGLAHLTDAYCRVVNGELFIFNMDIEPYEKASVFSHERRRERKLLLHRKQIENLEHKSLEKGLTIVPLRAYFNARGKVKLRIGLARGKAKYEKRDKIAKDEERREIQSARALRD